LAVYHGDAKVGKPGKMENLVIWPLESRLIEMTGFAPNPQIDLYLAEGCGRCAFWKTPQCKVHLWKEELSLLRKIIISCGLKEELKWSHPCYTANGKNILLLGAFKDYCLLSYLKGALIKDEAQILSWAGENSQIAKVFKGKNIEEILKWENEIRSYIFESVEIEKSGRKVEVKKAGEHPIPAELEEEFLKKPGFQMAFQGLTPGRQRAYIIFFSGAKQSATRASRIEKSIPRIMEGKGMMD
jgi:uncharacterized protein YdeI (YjbR/CyaY-like superfamily)